MCVDEDVLHFSVDGGHMASTEFPLNGVLNTLPFYLTAHSPVPSPFGMVYSETMKHHLFYSRCRLDDRMMKIVSTRSESGHGRYRVKVVRAALFLEG